MITEFGKYIRKLRIDCTVTLRQMADAMEISPSYLSSVETGKRNITPNFFNRVVSYFHLTGDQANELQKLADISQNKISMPLKKATYEQRNAAVAFARHLNQLSDEDLKKINNILEDS